MLVLTRRIGQTVLVGNDVKLTLVAVQGGNIRLAVEAPREVRVLRGELQERLLAKHAMEAVLQTA